MTPTEVKELIKVVGIKDGDQPSAKYPPLFSGYYTMTAGELMSLVNMVEARALAQVILESPMAKLGDESHA